MRCSAFILALTLVVSATVIGQAYGRQAFSPDELIKLDRDLDGTRVTVEGEAIGEDLRADEDHRWVNLLGESVAVGIYMRNADAALIDSFGSYKHSGDIVRVTGIVNIACDQHGGDFDVHAEVVQVVSEGQPIFRPPQMWKLVLASVFFAAFVLLTVMYSRRWSGGM